MRSGNEDFGIVSGKGGVGKSNVAVNLAMSLALSGKKVVLLDADLGMANVDLLCGVTSKYNLAHLVRGERKIEEILVPLENGVLLLPGGAGVQGRTELDDEDQSLLIDKLSVVERYADILLIDAGAGIHKNTMSFGTAADASGHVPGTYIHQGCQRGGEDPGHQHGQQDRRGPCGQHGRVSLGGEGDS